MHHSVELEQRYGANNYAPLPVVFTRGEGIYLWDTEGKRYMDMLSCYSAISHGHCNPRLVKKLSEQASRLALCSRAVYSDIFGSWCEYICKLTRMDKVLAMNTGAEAVETAIKAARKWAYLHKGVPHDQAEIIAVKGNFHGRTLAAVSMSSEQQYKEGFGPLTPGFKLIPYGNVKALREAINQNTAAFIVEPVQGEGGIIVPPVGYLRACADVCHEQNVLLLTDEVQSGLGRTGALLASWHENVQPDGLILGKALGGGLMPISAFLARADVMDVFKPGDHGSTFGGNPLAVAVSHAALQILEEENYLENSKILGEFLLAALRKLKSPLIKEVRGKGLFIGIEIETQKQSARNLALALLEQGLLTKETHSTTLRLAPPLMITRPQIEDALVILAKVLEV